MTSVASANGSVPVVLEFWAPWCAPCRTMAPHLERCAQAFAGQVQLVKVNASAQPELAGHWGVRSIPTLIVLQRGEEVLRLHGSQSAASLEALFHSLAAGQTPAQPTLHRSERLLRLVTGGTLIALALATPLPWPLALVGGLVFLSAVYDRCPLLRAVRRRLAQRKTAVAADVDPIGQDKIGGIL